MTARLRKFTSWLCILSILTWSILPLRGAQASESIWLEICTARGLERIAVDASHDPASSQDSETAGIHCPLCLLRFTVLPENPALELIPPVTRLAAWIIPAGNDAIVSFNTSPLQPRAPPSPA